MATISFTIPDAILARVNDGIAKFHNYQDQIPDPGDPASTIPNPETKAQFNKRMIKETVKNWVVQSETNDGAITARDTARTEVDIQD